MTQDELFQAATLAERTYEELDVVEPVFEIDLFDEVENLDLVLPRHTEEVKSGIKPAVCSDINIGYSFFDRMLLLKEQEKRDKLYQNWLASQATPSPVETQRHSQLKYNRYGGK